MRLHLERFMRLSTSRLASFFLRTQRMFNFLLYKHKECSANWTASREKLCEGLCESLALYVLKIFSILNLKKYIQTDSITKNLNRRLFRFCRFLTFGQFKGCSYKNEKVECLRLVSYTCFFLFFFLNRSN